MKLDPAAFTSVPHLRDKIHDPETSRFRNLDYDEMDRLAIASGLPADWRRPDELREQSRAETFAGREDQDIWIFAYGSLMWDPAFYFEEVRLAKTSLYQRRFCLVTEMGRGSPEHPGLMAALDHGGSCEGLAFRIRSSEVVKETSVIWRREMISYGYVPIFLQLETDEGPVEGLSFLVDHNGGRYAKPMHVDEAAKMIARGEGLLGTNIEYLHNLANQLELLGLHDEVFVELYDRAKHFL